MKLEDATITSQMQKELTELIDTKITHVLGGRKAKSYLDFNIRFLTLVYFTHDFNEQFDITVYSELKANRYFESKEYIMKWQPPMNHKLKIVDFNKKEKEIR